jgi:hypothetical protein
MFNIEIYQRRQSCLLLIPAKAMPYGLPACIFSSEKHALIIQIQEFNYDFYDFP